MKIIDTIDYIVFTRQGYDRTYYCVAGREISHQDAICFLNYDEAHSYANTLSQRLKAKTSNESRGTSQG